MKRRVGSQDFFHRRSCSLPPLPGGSLDGCYRRTVSHTNFSQKFSKMQRLRKSQVSRNSGYCGTPTNTTLTCVLNNSTIPYNISLHSDLPAQHPTVHSPRLLYHRNQNIKFSFSEEFTSRWPGLGSPLTRHFPTLVCNMVIITMQQGSSDPQWRLSLTSDPSDLSCNK